MEYIASRTARSHTLITHEYALKQGRFRDRTSKQQTHTHRCTIWVRKFRLYNDDVHDDDSAKLRDLIARS